MTTTETINTPLQAQVMPDEPLDGPSLKSRVEALLFISQHPLSAKEIAEQLHCRTNHVKEALLTLINEYNGRPDSALEIDDTEGYMLGVKRIHADLVKDLIPTDLPVSVLRTLSLIALEGPIIQTDLISMRGSSAYDHVKQLLGLNLVQRQRNERSYKVSVTRDFYRYFQLSGDKKELLERMNMAAAMTEPAPLSGEVAHTPEPKREPEQEPVSVQSEPVLPEQHTDDNPVSDETDLPVVDDSPVLSDPQEAVESSKENDEAIAS